MSVDVEAAMIVVFTLLPRNDLKDEIASELALRHMLTPCAEDDRGDEHYEDYEECVGIPFMMFDKFERYLTVRCCWCKELFHSVCRGDRSSQDFQKIHDTQGSDCAVAVYQIGAQWFAQGHYGSSHHDMCLYRFVNNDPPGGKADPVCDQCITRLVECGSLVIERDQILDKPTAEILKFDGYAERISLPILLNR